MSHRILSLESSLTALFLGMLISLWSELSFAGIAQRPIMIPELPPADSQPAHQPGKVISQRTIRTSKNEQTDHVVSISITVTPPSAVPSWLSTPWSWLSNLWSWVKTPLTFLLEPEKIKAQKHTADASNAIPDIKRARETLIVSSKNKQSIEIKQSETLQVPYSLPSRYTHDRFSQSVNAHRSKETRARLLVQQESMLRKKEVSKQPFFLSYENFLKSLPLEKISKYPSLYPTDKKVFTDYLAQLSSVDRALVDAHLHNPNFIAQYSLDGLWGYQDKEFSYHYQLRKKYNDFANHYVQARTSLDLADMYDDPKFILYYLADHVEKWIDGPPTRPAALVMRAVAAECVKKLAQLRPSKSLQAVSDYFQQPYVSNAGVLAKLFTDNMNPLFFHSENLTKYLAVALIADFIYDPNGASDLPADLGLWILSRMPEEAKLFSLMVKRVNQLHEARNTGVTHSTSTHALALEEINDWQMKFHDNPTTATHELAVRLATPVSEDWGIHTTSEGEYIRRIQALDEAEKYLSNLQLRELARKAFMPKEENSYWFRINWYWACMYNKKIRSLGTVRNRVSVRSHQNG